MGNWAQVNESNTVVQVIVADDDKQAWLTETLGGTWVQTSYNTKGGVHYEPQTGEPSADQSKALRKNFASIGYSYDQERDAFIAPKPNPSIEDGIIDWSLNEETCLWEPVTE